MARMPVSRLQPEQLGDPALATALADPRPLLLVDGECVMCSRGAQFVMRHDRRGALRIGTAQSATGSAIYSRLMLDPDATFLLIAEGRVFTRSAATIETFRRLGGRWLWVARLLTVVPERLRDALYDWIARNRFRLFGRRETCLVPTPEQRDRFVA